MTGVDLVDLGAPIAEGRTAELYAWHSGQVLKLYRPGFEHGLPEYEARIARAVSAAGVAAPRAGQLLQVNGRVGLEYERLEGSSILQVIISRPWRAAWAGSVCAEVQAGLHAVSIEGLPAQRQRLAERIQSASPLAPDLRERLLHTLQGLPEASQLCHGDFHPGNLLMSQRGPVVIDWVDAVSGHPAADVARTAILVYYSSLPSGPAGWYFGMLRTMFYFAYQRRYRQLAPQRLDSLQTWLPVVAAARLAENIASEESGLLRLARQVH